MKMVCEGCSLPTTQIGRFCFASMISVLIKQNTWELGLDLPKQISAHTRGGFPSHLTVIPCATSPTVKEILLTLGTDLNSTVTADEPRGEWSWVEGESQRTKGTETSQNEWRGRALWRNVTKLKIGRVYVFIMVVGEGTGMLRSGQEAGWLKRVLQQSRHGWKKQWLGRTQV